MGLLDKLKRNASKAKEVAEGNADKIADGVHKATEFVDEKTKGKYTDKLHKVDKAADDFAEKAGGDDDSGEDGGSGGSTSS